MCFKAPLPPFHKRHRQHCKLRLHDNETRTITYIKPNLTKHGDHAKLSCSRRRMHVRICSEARGGTGRRERAGGIRRPHFQIPSPEMRMCMLSCAHSPTSPGGEASVIPAQAASGSCAASGDIDAACARTSNRRAQCACTVRIRTAAGWIMIVLAAGCSECQGFLARAPTATYMHNPHA